MALPFGRYRAATAVGVMLLVGLASVAAAARVWSPNPAMGKPTLDPENAPKTNMVVTVGTEVTCICSRPGDTDSWTCPEENGTDADDMDPDDHPAWSCSAGSFKDDEDIGTEVIWVAPATAQGGVWVRVHDDDLPKAVVPPETGSRDDTATWSDDATNISVVEYILTQYPDKLWWFGGANAANYDEQVTLTLEGITEGEFDWEVVAGTAYVDFSNDSDTMQTIDDNTVVLKSTGGAPASVYAVAVTVSVDSSPCTGGRNLTVYWPKHEITTGITDNPHGTIGYESLHYVKVCDQFMETLPASIEYNECWTESQQYDYEGCDWPQWPEGSGLASPTNIDNLGAWPTGLTPTAMVPQSPLGTTKVMHWNGEHYFGSSTRGQGIRVLIDGDSSKTWQYYRDHGRREDP